MKKVFVIIMYVSVENLVREDKRSFLTGLGPTTYMFWNIVVFFDTLIGMQTCYTVAREQLV